MEHLKVYASDTDSSEDEKSTTANKEEHSSQCQESALAIDRLQGPFNSNMLVDIGADFFGFKTLPGSKKEKTPFTKCREETKKINSKYGEIELPEGEFWKDISSDNIQDYDLGETSSCDHFNIQINSKKNSPGNNKLDHNKTCKRPNLGPVYDSCYYHSKKQLLTEDLYSAHTNHGLELHSCTETQPSASIKKKMYYIHSKVAPYLITQTFNKCSSKLAKSWCAHEGVVNRLAWNVPNYSHLLASAGMDTAIRVWNVWSSTDTEATKLCCHKKAVTHVAWFMNGLKIVSCSYDRTAQVTDVETGKCTAQCEHIGFVTSACLHPSNPNLFVSGTDNMMCMWDARIPEAPVKHFTYKDNIGQVQDVLFISNGQELISCGDLVCRDSADRSIMAWDFRSGVVLSNQIFQERFTCTRLKLHPDNSHFLAQTQGGYVAIFSTSSPYKLNKSKRYDGHKMQGYRIGFDVSPSGNIVYSGSSTGGVFCYDEHSGKIIKQLNCKGDVITDVACHPVLSSLIAACTWGGSICLWQ